MLTLLWIFLSVNFVLFLLSLIGVVHCRISGMGPWKHPTFEFHLCPGCTNWTLLYLNVHFNWNHLFYKGEKP